MQTRDVQVRGGVTLWWGVLFSTRGCRRHECCDMREYRGCRPGASRVHRGLDDLGVPVFGRPAIPAIHVTPPPAASRLPFCRSSDIFFPFSFSASSTRMRKCALSLTAIENESFRSLFAGAPSVHTNTAASHVGNLPRPLATLRFWYSGY